MHKSANYAYLCVERYYLCNESLSAINGIHEKIVKLLPPPVRDIATMIHACSNKNNDN